MDFDVLLWIVAGVIATVIMTIPQLVQIYFQGKNAVPEFTENAYILSRLTGGEWEQLYWKAVPLHFGHGILGAFLYGGGLVILSIEISILTSFLYGLILWLSLLLTHERITGENIYANRNGMFGSFLWHQAYSFAFLLVI
ncbi:MAG: hypothetical protein ACFFB3_07360 [Candidatus Hodarchaeota archaeon]